MDLWAVRGDADSVSIGGEDVSTVSRTETIPVRGAEPVEIEVVSVPAHGVILPSDLAPLPITRAGQRILFRWIGFAPTHEALGFARFDRATDLEEFEAAADIMEIATFNFVAAHAEGITYRSSPSVPVRRGAITARRQPWRILDGDDADALWSTEILGPGQLPRSRGGSRGWVATANNEPFGFNDDGDYTNGPYYFGMFFDPGTRAHRIEEELVRLTSRGAVTLEDMQTLQDDTRSVLADDLVPARTSVRSSSGSATGIGAWSARRRRPSSSTRSSTSSRAISSRTTSPRSSSRSSNRSRCISSRSLRFACAMSSRAKGSGTASAHVCSSRRSRARPSGSRRASGARMPTATGGAMSTGPRSAPSSETRSGLRGFQPTAGMGL
jgi:penicillin amidase